jgi:hypothetical protein
MKIIANVSSLFFLIIFISCSASTDTRYEKEKTDDKEKIVIKDEKFENTEEDFDFTQYKTEFDIPEKQVKLPEGTTLTNLKIWYQYEVPVHLSNNIIDKVSGYRVLVIATDNLEEANNMRTEIYFKVPQREVYVIFDPPFYKVMVGDFIELSEARELHFRLNQMGYSEARVVNEIVNIFEQ